MIEYFFFFSYSGIAFLVGLVVWYVIPKPDPYDYTTIPGSKPTDEEKGDLVEIQKRGFLGFVDNLHVIYGPLASFNLGRQYVVSVASYEHYRRLGLYDELIDSSKLYPLEFALLNLESSVTIDFCQLLKSLPDAFDSVLLEDPHSAVGDDGYPSDYILRKLLHEAFQCAPLGLDANSFAYLLAKRQDELTNMLEFPWRDQDPGKIFGDVESISAQFDEVVNAAHVAYRCNSYAIRKLKKYEKLRNEILSELSSGIVCFETLDGTLLVSMFLETLRMACPLSIYCRKFASEIDLDGHPIPAKTPILVIPGIILGEERLIPSPDQFQWDRFHSENRSSFIKNLPYLALGLSKNHWEPVYFYFACFCYSISLLFEFDLF